MNATVAHAGGSRCARAAVSSSVTLLWFVVTVPLVCVALVGLTLAPGVQTPGDLIPAATTAISWAWVPAFFVVPCAALGLIVSLVVPTATVHGDHMPGRSTMAVGSVGAAIGMGFAAIIPLLVAVVQV